MKFLRDLWYLTGRALRTTLRIPWALIPNVAISLFFLFVYNGGLSGIAALPQFAGTSYIAFILPVAVVSGAVGGAGGAGQALIRDIESGYFTKLALSPSSRLAILLAPMLAGLAQLMAQTLIILAVARTMGLHIPSGIVGYVGILGLTLGWGLAFSAYSVAFALRSRSGQAAQAATFVFFPLLFLSDTFVPMKLIQAHWMRMLIRINPTTYVFNAMRDVMTRTIHAASIDYGILAIILSCGVTLGWAVMAARRSFSQYS